MKNIRLINFTQCSDDELAVILEWRNSEHIRKWMLNSSEITLSSHFSFVDSLKNSKNKLYFLVQKNDVYLGVVDFTNITSSSCSIGVYKNPNIPAIGDTLIKIIYEYAFTTLSLDTIQAEVFAENHKAINLYRKHNFTEISRETFKTKELLCMERKNENRQF